MGPTANSQWKGKGQGWRYLWVYKKTPQSQWPKRTTIFFICSQPAVWAGLSRDSSTKPELGRLKCGMTPGGWSQQMLMHMTGRWYWLTGGPMAGLSARTPPGGLAVPAQLLHSIVTGFQEQVSQENQVETVAAFMASPQKSQNVTSAMVLGPLKCGPSGHKRQLSVREASASGCKKHLAAILGSTTCHEMDDWFGNRKTHNLLSLIFHILQQKKLYMLLHLLHPDITLEFAV